MSNTTENNNGGQLMQLAPEQLGRSPWNRKHFDPVKLAELRESIREKGVQVPLKARKNPGYELKKNPDGSSAIYSKSGTRVPGVGGVVELSRRVVELNARPYELIMGERRWTNGTDLKLSQLPVIVIEASDQEAIEQQAIENIQREDLNPIEEAEKYEQLVDIETAKGTAKKAAVEAVAKRLGKGTSTLYERLSLLDLSSSAAREACASGRLPASHAALIVKLGDDKQAQDELTEAIFSPSRHDETIEGEPGHNEKKPILSYRDTIDVFKRCKHRSEQRTKHGTLAAEFAKKGHKVLSPAENKKAFKNDYDDVPEGYIDADNTNYDYWKTWKVLMGKHAPAPVLAMTPRGNCVVVYPRKESEEAITKNGVKKGSSSSSGRSEADKAKERAHRDRVQRFAEMLGPVADSAEKMESPEIWRYLFREMVHGGHADSVWLMVKRRWPETKRDGMYAATDKWAKTATGKQLRGATIEILFGKYKPSNWGGGFGDHFKGDCELFGVQPIPWTAKVQTPAPAKAEAEKAKPAAKAKAGAKGKGGKK